MLPIAGLRAADVGDIVTVDLELLKELPLSELLELMRRCGVSTEGINSVSSAATRLIERGKIVLGDR